MLKKIRMTLAAVCFIAVTLLFLDFSGTLQHWLGWLAKIQFLPAVLAANFITVAVLLLVTLLFGRIYCSVICPLGVFQDVVYGISFRRRSKKTSYSKEVKWLRYGVLVLFVIALVAGLNALAAIIAPYSAWGRIVQNLFAPIYGWCNNLFASIAAKHESYAFVTKEVWLKSLPTFIVAAVTFIVIIVLAWRGGRTWCNTICPVGTTLSFFSRFAMFRPVIDAEKCKSCRACERKCKASCINIDSKKIDYSRCVDCFDCLDNCRFGALKYRYAWKKQTKAMENAPAESASPADAGRRAFLVGSAVVLAGTTLKAQTDSTATDTTAVDDKKRDGGLAEVIAKKAPKRSVPVTPFGSKSVDSFYSHCTACQLCVTVCPNNVLRPSSSLEHLMQPEMSFERGYCRPECTKCSEVCPAGAILKITPEEKTTWKVGTATVDYDLCVADSQGIECGNCARHCPAGAIRMVSKTLENGDVIRIPSVMEERCIGCGACENLCPVRPISAITVNGYEIHHKEE